MGESFLKFTAGFLAIIFLMLASAYLVYLAFSDTSGGQQQVVSAAI